MNSIKENMIRNYLYKVDWTKNWSYSEIENGMVSFLGERPSLDITYTKDVIVNESEGSSREFLRLDKIYVVFTDVDEKIKRMEFSLNG